MNPIDLTTVPLVKGWLASNGRPSANDTDDPNIELCITSFSMYALLKTGRGAQNNSVPTQSPFNQAVTYADTYNGTGKSAMFLRNTPILSVQSLIINGVTIPQSIQWNQTGWVIDADGKRLHIRSGGGTSTALVTDRVLGRLIFNSGIQNVSVNYTAGYPEQVTTDELQTVPASPGPYTIDVDGYWLSDLGVKYFQTGDPLTPVSIAPNVGEYYVNSVGQYLFNAGDAGQVMMISYNEPGTPGDLQLAATIAAATNYKRKSWIDQKSQSMAHGAGTVTYRDWMLPPEVVQTLVDYTRTAML
jgi:hypothetical protein